MSKKQNNVGPNGRSVLSLRPLEQKAEKNLDEVSERLTKHLQNTGTTHTQDVGTPTRSPSDLPATHKTEPSPEVVWDQIANVPEKFSPGLRGSLLDRPETESLPPFTPPVKIESEVTPSQSIGYVYVIIHKTSVAVFETPNEVTPGRIKSIITSSLSGGVFGLDVVGRWATLAIDATRELTTVKAVLDGKVESLNGQYHIWSKSVAEAVINDMVATGQWVKMPTNYMNSVDDKELCPVLRFTHVENKNALSQPKTT